MSADYPTTLHSFTDTSCSETRTISTVMNELQDEAAALQTKLGADASAVTTSHDYKLSEITGTDKAAGKTATQTLSSKTLASPVVNTGISGTAVLDEDTMVSDSATKIATQQSIKAYADTNAVKKVHCIYTLGDSLTRAGGIQTQLDSLLDAYWAPVINKGVGSNTTTLSLTRLYTDVLNSDEGTPEYVVVWLGVNDLANDVATATIESNLQAIYTAISDTGAKVIAVNVTPWKGSAAWSAARQTETDALNAWIAGTATDIDYNIDMYSLLEDPDVDDTLLPAYDDGGNIHLSTDGYNLVGTTINSSVGTWVRSTTEGIIDPDSYNIQTTATSLAKQALINGNFDVWQRGTSFAGAGAGIYTADRWFSQRSAGVAGMTVSQQSGTGVQGSYYSIRTQRDSGNSATNTCTLSQALPTIDSVKFRGKKITLSFWAKCGADFSATSSILNARIYTGTGTNQQVGSFTGGVINGSENNTLTTSWQKFTVTTSLPIIATATQIGVWFVYTPVGTASTNDWFEIAQVQLCEGTEALPFTPKSTQQEEWDCYQYAFYPMYNQSTGNTRARMVLYTANSLNFVIGLPRVMYDTNPTLTSGTEVTDWQVYTTAAAAQTGFSISIASGSRGNTGYLNAAKTGHGLTDGAILIKTGVFGISAEF